MDPIRRLGERPALALARESFALGVLSLGAIAALSFTARRLDAQALPSMPSDSIVRLAIDPARAAGRPYVILLDEQENRIEPDGRSVRRSRQVLQVLDQSVVRGMSERAFGFSKSHQSLTIDWIRVLKPTGEVVSNKAAQEQESDVPAPMANPVYQEQRLRRVSLAGVAVGTIVDIQQTNEERGPYRAGDFLTGFAVNGGLPVVRSRFVVDVPEGFVPRIIERNLTFRRVEDVHDGRHRYIWAMNDVPAVPGEPFAADSNGIMMSIGVSSPGTWSDLAKWYDGLARDRYTLTPAVMQRVDSLVKVSGARTRLDTIRAVHRWVAQDVRYVSVSLGIGGYQPRAPAEVIASGFGDCKDKATLFVAALRRYKIAANPVLLSLSAHPDPALPSMFQFNHAIAAVKEASGWTFTDLTAEYVPYGTIPDSYQGQFGIVVLPDGRADEVRFPRAPIASNTSVMRVQLSVDSTGRVTGAIDETVTGGSAIGMRQVFGQPLDSARRENVQKALAQRLFPTDATVDSVRAFNGHDFSAETVLRYRVKAENVFKTVGSTKLFSMNTGFKGPALGLKNRARELEARATRVFPIDAAQILGQLETVTDFRLTIPAGWTAELPKNIVATSFFGHYESTWTQEGREVHLVRRIRGERGYFPPQRIAEVIVWLKTVGADDYEFLSLKPPTVP